MHIFFNLQQAKIKIIILRKMYNSHLAEKQQSIENKYLHKKSYDEIWRKRYSTEIQPQLLDHYNKRINSFIRRMEEKPLQINVQEGQKGESQKKFISNETFKFRDSNDWKSILNSMERAEIKLNQQIMKDKYGDASLAHRSVFSESEYIPLAFSDFRIRNKKKQINPPMKYTYKIEENTLGRIRMLKKLQKKKNPESHKESKNQSLDQTKNNSISSTQQLAQRLHTEDLKALENESVFSYNKADDEEYIEQEARLYEKRREIVEKKLHFKKIMDLSVNMKEGVDKQNLKDILRKCGVVKMKKKFYTQETETDLLSSELENSLLKN